MKREPSYWAKKARYRFDNFITRGKNSIFISLLVMFCSVLFIVTVLRGLLLFIHPEEAENIDNFLRHLYITFLHLTDPGTMITDINTSIWYKTTAVIAGLTGIVLLSMLIAVITTSLDRKLRQLMKGRSQVIEKDHTLILGWNDRGIEILRELIMANESESRPVIVILSNEPREAIEDFLRSHLKDRKNSRIVTRSGNPSSLTDLYLVSVRKCKSVIALATCDIDAGKTTKSTSDAFVIKTVLAVRQARKEVGMCATVAELFTTRNRDIIESISPGNVTTLNAKGVLAKLIVQTSRSIGLSVVLSEMLSFDGCEMYFYLNKGWQGKPFSELAMHFDDGIPLGVCFDGALNLNPPNDHVMRDNEEILILAEDDSTISYQSKPLFKANQLVLPNRRLERRIERELIIGWSPKASLLIRDYAEYLVEGSQIDVMYKNPNEKLAKEIIRLSRALPKIHITLHDVDPLKVEHLKSMKPFTFDNILVLSQGGVDACPEKTDSETMIILLLLRGIIANKASKPKTKIITEVLNSENQDLISSTGVNDFIISNRMISMMLAQMSEDNRIKLAYNELFTAEGSEIYLKPVRLYFDTLPVEVTYADLIALAATRREVCLGIKKIDLENEPSKNFGITLVPKKDEVIQLKRHDTLVVLAEDET